MIQTAGISIQSTYNGTPTAIVFNLKKYGKLLREFFFQNKIEFPIVDAPNVKTLNALKEYKKGKGKGKVFHSYDDLLQDLND